MQRPPALHIDGIPAIDGRFCQSRMTRQVFRWSFVRVARSKNPR